MQDKEGNLRGYKCVLFVDLEGYSKHKYYGDEEKVTEEDFRLVNSLGKEKLRLAYAG